MKPGEIHYAKYEEGNEFIVISEVVGRIFYHRLRSGKYVDNESTDNKYFMSHPILTSIFVGEV